MLGLDNGKASRLYGSSCGFLDLKGGQTLYCISDICSDLGEVASKKMIERYNDDAVK